MKTLVSQRAPNKTFILEVDGVSLSFLTFIGGQVGVRQCFFCKETILEICFANRIPYSQLQSKHFVSPSIPVLLIITIFFFPYFDRLMFRNQASLANFILNATCLNQILFDETKGLNFLSISLSQQSKTYNFAMYLSIYLSLYIFHSIQPYPSLTIYFIYDHLSQST